MDDMIAHTSKLAQLLKYFSLNQSGGLTANVGKKKYWIKNWSF